MLTITAPPRILTVQHGKEKQSGSKKDWYEGIENGYPTP
jgi:hypothetical protein